MLAITDEPTILSLFEPSKGTYANETLFLTSFDSFETLKTSGHLKVKIIDTSRLSGLVLLTDGLEHAAMKGDRPNAPFIIQLMGQLEHSSQEAFCQSLCKYLSNSQKLRELTDDDKTLVLALNTQRPPDLNIESYPAALRSNLEKPKTKKDTNPRQPHIIHVANPETYS